MNPQPREKARSSSAKGAKDGRERKSHTLLLSISLLRLLRTNPSHLHFPTLFALGCVCSLSVGCPSQRADGRIALTIETSSEAAYGIAWIHSTVTQIETSGPFNSSGRPSTRSGVTRT